MTETRFRFRNSTNSLEKELAPLIEGKFPNLEDFWSTYLIPLTGAPDDYNWRNDTLPNLEQIGMASYGILKSINFINITKPYVTVGDRHQRYKNIFYHFGLIFDSVDNIARNIVIIQGKLGIIDLEERIMRTKEELMSKYENWVDKKYKTAYEKMIHEGKPIFYYPQHNHNFISIIVPKPDSTKYHKFVQELKQYRNFFIHTPGVDISIQPSTGKQFAIKKEYVDICKYWSTFRTAPFEHPDWFDSPVNIVSQDFDQTITLLNNIWKYFIEEIDKIYRHEGFDNIFRNYDREKRNN